jgi:hypothetical protein
MVVETTVANQQVLSCRELGSGLASSNDPWNSLLVMKRRGFGGVWMRIRRRGDPEPFFLASRG